MTVRLYYMIDSHRHTVAERIVVTKLFYLMLFIAVLVFCIIRIIYTSTHAMQYNMIFDSNCLLFFYLLFFFRTAAAACRQQYRSLIPARIFMTVLLYLTSVRFCFAYNWQAISHNTPQQQQYQ